ncbi:hypothetical protein LCGC14_0894260 [marine sediment metagenome]|uniref:Uncharacterized protein n=1 Tax=marine sediment metagenome TaxID=412755 RepID=A0A0F9RHJ4_9ZZZZ
MSLGILDPRKKENWKKVVVNRWFWIMIIGFVGYCIIQFVVR